VPELRFVTTTAFNIKLSSDPASTERRQFSLQDLDAGISAQIATKLKKELGLSQAHSLLPNVVFEYSPLSLHDHSAHALGKVTTFLENQYPHHGISPSAAYRALVGEIMRLTNYEHPLETFADILFHSGMSRSRFQALLDQIPAAKNPHQTWLEAKQDLTACNVAFPLITAIRREWLQYEADRTDFSNHVLQDARKQAKALIQIEAMNPACLHIMDAVDKTLLKIKTPLLAAKPYLTAMALIEYYEQQQLPPSTPQPPQEAP
jgi:hypothetical protein